MSTSTAGTATKRRRVDTAGNAEVSASTVSQPPATGSMPPGVPAGDESTSGVPKDVPKEWGPLFKQSPPLVAPPLPALKEMGRLYSLSLSGYREHCKAHQRRIAGKERFTELSQKEEIPAETLAALKGPVFTFPPGFVADDDMRVSSAQEEYLAALKAARQAAVKYIVACHASNVDFSAVEMKGQARLEGLSADLTQYSDRILTDAGSSTTLWAPFVEAVVRVLGEQMAAIRVEVICKDVADKEEASRKSAALATAQAEAETAQGTKSVDDLRSKDQSSERRQRKRRRKGRKEGQRSQRERGCTVDGELVTEGVRAACHSQSKSPLTTTSVPVPELQHVVSSWRFPPDVPFHRLKPASYPVLFFSASQTLQQRFVTSRMSVLFYETRLTNQAFHNLTEVTLSYAQVKMFALNTKF
ncbi:hypothetical protein BV25DRAFT_1797876, partial [Artomyces pyxidatus]